MTPSQYQSHARRLDQQRRQAISKYNSDVRRYNADLRRRAADFNRAVSSYNSWVRNNRRRLESELGRMTARSTTVYLTHRASVQVLQGQFEYVAAAAEEGRWPDDAAELFDLAEGEVANAIAAQNRLDQAPDLPGVDAISRLDPLVSAELQALGPDVEARWHGAVFALDPRNPDAARHFCASARELLDTVLETSAKDADVMAANPSAKVTPEGRPTRRERVRFCLARSGRDLDGLPGFVVADIENVVDLFKSFNDGTHGAAGRFSVAQLEALKQRAERAIHFLFETVRV